TTPWFVLLLQLRRSTLLPYTTLFRSFTWITVALWMLSLLKALISKAYNTGSKLEFITASYTGRESEATTSWLTTRSNTFLAFFRSEEHTSELQSRENLVFRLLFASKN